MAKWKYNPFRMWGSYVGAITLPLITFYKGFDVLFPGCPNNLLCMPNPVAWIMPYVFVSIPVGFLLGWGIHSLFRRFWK